MQNRNGTVDVDSGDSSSDESSDESGDESGSGGESSSSVSVRQKGTWYMQGCLTPKVFTVSIWCPCFILNSNILGQGGTFESSFSGIKVCREAFLHLLGIGRARLIRTKRSFRGKDMRSAGPMHKISGIFSFVVFMGFHFWF